MRALISMLLLTTAAITLNGCAGFEKGNGFDHLNTESPEEKEEQKWFDKYYGEKDKNCDDSFWTTEHFCNP